MEWFMNTQIRHASASLGYILAQQCLPGISSSGHVNHAPLLSGGVPCASKLGDST